MLIIVPKPIEPKQIITYQIVQTVSGASIDAQVLTIYY
jgi:hypothetical protein